MDKRGITLSTLIAIILLVLAFGIIFFFIYNLGFNQRADKEACHQSVIMRGTVASIPLLDMGASEIPLKCKEGKVCLTSSKLGSCDEFAGEKGIATAVVKDKTGIEKTIAREALECWTVMGEGKLDLFSDFVATRYGYGKIYPSCVICSRIAVDKSIALTTEQLQSVDVEQYMATHAVSGTSVSYLTTMLGENTAANKAGLGIDAVSIVQNEINYETIQEDTTSTISSTIYNGIEVKVGTVLAQSVTGLSEDITVTEISGESILAKGVSNYYIYQTSRNAEEPKGWDTVLEKEIVLDTIKDTYLRLEVDEFSYMFNGAIWYYKRGTSDWIPCNEDAFSGRNIIRSFGVITDANNKNIIKHLNTKNFLDGIEIIKNSISNTQTVSVYYQDGVKEPLNKYTRSELANLSPAQLVEKSTTILKEKFGDANWRGQELAVLFMQISAPSQTDVFTNNVKAIGTIIGINFAVNPTGAITQLTKVPAGRIITIGSKVYKGGQFLPKAFSLAKSAISPTTKAILALAAIDLVASQANAAYNRNLAGIACSDFSSGGDNARSGCSVIRVVKYDTATINQICSGNIESIP
jgi:hypothetical protein